jgi:hypothetical protein
VEDFDWATEHSWTATDSGSSQGRLVVNTPKSGKLRTVDCLRYLTTRLRELKSIREAQAVVDGNSLSPWVFPALTDAGKPLMPPGSGGTYVPGVGQRPKSATSAYTMRATLYASMLLRRGVPSPNVSKPAWTFVHPSHGGTCMATSFPVTTGHVLRAWR